MDFLPYGLDECAEDKDVDRKGLSGFVEGEVGC